MKSEHTARSVTKWLAAGFGLAAGSYAAYITASWLRYGKLRRTYEEDALLNTFMPHYEVVDRWKVYVNAPADFVLTAATELDFESCPVIRGIFKVRQWILRGKPDDVLRPRGLLAETKSLGWGVLAQLPGREIIMGAVTKPWEANPTFRSLPSDQFAAFQEPGFVKIIWTLRADETGPQACVFQTETRALATDPESRRKFRWYWSFLSPGIHAIRAAMLPSVKVQAERRWRATA